METLGRGSIINAHFFLYFLGSGLGFLNIASFSILQHYFHRRQFLATSIALGGVGVGQIAFSLVSQKLLASIGWQWTCAVYGASGGLVCSACAALFIPLQSERKNFKPVFKRHRHGISRLVDHSVCLFTIHNIDLSKTTLKRIQESQTESKIKRILYDMRDFLKGIILISGFRNVSVLLYSMASFCLATGIQLAVQFTPARAKERGLTKEEAAYLLSIIGGTSLVGRIITGIAVTLPVRMRGQNTIYLFMALNTCCAVIQLISPTLVSFAQLAMASTAMGFVYGNCYFFEWI